MDQHHDDISSTGWLASVAADAERIRGQAHTLDLDRYLAKWLPVVFPNKGVREHIADRRIIEVHHEPLGSGTVEVDDTDETLIRHYGNTHQLDYCYQVRGHRFEEDQRVVFRGVLGRNRLYKLLLSLLICGVPVDRLRVIDHHPSYEELAETDLKGLNLAPDLILIGGLVVGGLTFAQRFRCGSVHRGQILSWSEGTIGVHRIVLTTFPYGDLCEIATRGLFRKSAKRLWFVGAAGALSEDAIVGDVFRPERIDLEGTLENAQSTHQELRALDAPPIRGAHGNVTTTITETVPLMAALRSRGITSVDVEVAYFHKACRQRGKTQTGIVLFVSDVVGRTAPFSEVDYASLWAARSHVMNSATLSLRDA